MRTIFAIGTTTICLLSLGSGVAVWCLLDAAQPKDSPKEIRNSIEMRLRYIPEGKFTMGSPAVEKHRNADETQHEVTIRKAFYLGACEVTQEQYQKIMGANPSHFSGQGGGKQQVVDRDTNDFPVERVSWNDAVEFCKKLSTKENKTYRLPTEAEWEYACRAGTKTVFHTGDDFNSYLANINGLNYSSYGKETSGPFYRSTRSVAEYKRNDFGLSDMHGNVQEWCADWYAEDYYKVSPKEDPSGPKEGTERVLRGGAWPSSAKSCRCAARNHLPPDEKTYTTGFRIVLQVK
jgi:formylglycine-generating enzyme required for sulfatase activity